MTTIAIPDSLNRAEAESVIRQVLAGRGLDAVAAQFDGRGTDVRKFARECGAPNNRSRLRTALSALEAGKNPDLDTDFAADLEPVADQPDRADLISRGKNSTKTSTVHLAERIEEMLDRLGTYLEAEETERANADEIAQLQARIAELRGQKPTGASATSGNSESAAIRVWAAKNGITVGSVGRIPQAVRDQYAKANS